MALIMAWHAYRSNPRPALHCPYILSLPSLHLTLPNLHLPLPSLHLALPSLHQVGKEVGGKSFPTPAAAHPLWVQPAHPWPTPHLLLILCVQEADVQPGDIHAGPQHTSGGCVGGRDIRDIHAGPPHTSGGLGGGGT